MKKSLIFGVLVIAVVVTAIVLYTRGSITGGVIEENVKEIKINAFQFGYDPAVINLRYDEKVKIIINNLDVPHGIVIPDFNVKGEKEVEFTANKKGEFRWFCYVPCGPGHQSMGGKIVIK